jgi:hypothetical protein
MRRVAGGRPLHRDPVSRIYRVPNFARACGRVPVTLGQRGRKTPKRWGGMTGLPD